MSSAQELDVLLRSYAQQSEGSTLNIGRRKALHQYAAVNGLKFEQDCVGNVYLTRATGDHTLANIAIAFALDAQDSSQSFSDAFLTYDRLSQEDLPCGVTLMGFTTSHQEDIGLQAWENAITILGRPAPLPATRLFDQFSKLPSPTTFAFSAVFQVAESPYTALSLFGSSILTGKAQKFLEDKKGARVSTQEFRRAPRLKIEGLGAKEVARKVVCAYSEYVVALFENFE